MVQRVVDSSQYLVEQGLIAQVADDQFNLIDYIGQVIALARTQIVDNAHRMSIRKQTPTKMRSNKSRPTSHQILGHLFLHTLYIVI